MTNTDFIAALVASRDALMTSSGCKACDEIAAKDTDILPAACAACSSELRRQSQPRQAGDLVKTVKLYNRGPVSLAYRGLVEVSEDGQMTYLDSRAPVRRHHGDVTCPHLDHFHGTLSGDLCTPLCADSVDREQLPRRVDDRAAIAPQTSTQQPRQQETTMTTRIPNGSLVRLDDGTTATAYLDRDGTYRTAQTSGHGGTRVDLGWRREQLTVLDSNQNR